MSEKFDTVVIGGGHNGLTAATLLAKKGEKTLLVERRPFLGGIAAGEEFHPGYKTHGLLHDTGGVRKQVIKELSLEKFGLVTTGKRSSQAVLGKDGRCIILSGNDDETRKNIANYSEKDAQAYIEYKKFINKIGPVIRDIMDNVPPDLVNMGSGDLWELAKKGLSLKRLGKATMMELLKVGPMSVQDFLDERFETEFLKAGLAGPSIYGSFTSPRSAYTTLNLLLWECLSNEEVVGGPQALIDALEKAAKDAGVTIMTDNEVAQILLNDDRKVNGVRLKNGEEYATGKVAASCAPRETFFNLLAPNHIEYSLQHGIDHYRSRGTTAKLNLALNAPLNIKGLNNEVEFIRTGNTWLEMEKAYDAVKYDEYSTEPVLDIHISKNAPEGHSTVSILIHYAPYELKDGWAEAAKNSLTNVITTLSQYCENLEHSIVASELLTPVDLEERYNLPNGHIFHGEHAVDQLLTRPLPSCMRYATPIEGLYLCGSGSHPGGGITCMPGMLGAKTILKG